MKNQELLQTFYTAFANGNSKEMVNCYHEQIVFEDPAFGVLKGEDAKAMWHLLLSRNNKLKVSCSNIATTEKVGSANWTAEYVYAKTGRKVVNNVVAKFEFADGKIIKHTDQFDLYKWTQQALGLKGYLFGWTAFMKLKTQKMTKELLIQYRQNQL